MAKHIEVGINIKGLNLDKNIVNLGEGEYRYAKNCLMADNMSKFQNDYSNKLCIDFGANIIGNLYIDNYIQIIFLDDNRIVKADLNECIYTVIMESDCLGFDTCNWIKVRMSRLNDCGKIVIYWTDNINPVRYLNIDEPAPDTCDKLMLADCNITPNFDDIVVNDFGGSVVTGVYHFFVKIGNGDVWSNWMGYSNPIYIYDDQFYSNTFAHIDGAIGGLITTKSITLNISNLDSKYSQIQIAVIKQSELIRTSYLIVTSNYSGNSFVYNFTGITEQDVVISLNELTVPEISYQFAKTLEMKDNRLFLSGITTVKNINYQKYANNIQVNYVTTKIRVDDLPMGYKNPEIMANYKSRLRDEIYNLGIVWDICDGTQTNVFPLIGRVANSNDLELLTDNELPNQINCDLEKWKNGNTAYRTEFNECESGELYNHIYTSNLYICAKRYQDGILIEDTCSDIPVNYCLVGSVITNDGDIEIETFVYNYQYQYTECDVVLEGWEIESACNGYFIKWKRCTINEEVESDLCAEDRFIPCIRTRGELSYFESCERYPDTKDCDGNYMFPHHTDSEGNIIMDYIRLFKMPDNHIEPCFECETNNVEPDGLPYEKCYIFPLGLEFSNIVPPDDIPIEQIAGYRIVYMERTPTVKSIIAKGILHGTFMDNDANSTSIIPMVIPKHAVNSNEYYNSTGGGGYHTTLNCETLGAYTFISPNTLFNTPDLSAEYIRIEKEYRGKGRVYPNDIVEVEGDCFNVGRRKNININQQINSLPNQRNRVLRGLRYATENTVVENTNNLSFPLDNRWRESSVYLEILKNPLLLINPSSEFHGDPINLCDDSPNVAIGDSDQSFKKDYNELDNELTMELNSSAAWYVSLKRNNCDIYGQVNSWIYIDTGTKTNNKFQDKITCFHGDTFINYFTYKRTSNVELFKDGARVYETPTDSSWEDYRFNPKLLKTLIHCFVESDYNVDMRYEGDNENEWYYPKLKNGAIFLDSHVPDITNPNDPKYSFLNRFYVDFCDFDYDITQGYFYKDFLPSMITDFSDNYSGYNFDFNKLNNEKIYSVIPYKYNTCDCANKLSNIIAASDKTNLSNYNLNSFKVSNFIQVPNYYGDIEEIFVLNNKLYAHTKDILWQIFTNDKQLKVDDTTVYLGTGELFSEDPLPIYASSVGFGGNKFKFGYLLNELGIIWYDTYAGKIHLLNDKMETLSDEGMSYFFKDTAKFCGNDCNPILFTYDYYNNRFLMTKKDKVSDTCDKSYTISYSFATKSFVSFHSFIPDYYIYDRNNYYSSKNGKLYTHNIKCDFTTYYDIPYSLEYEAVISPKLDLMSNTTGSIHFNTMAYKCDNNCQDIYMNDITFNRALIYNSNQSSGYLNLQFNKGGRFFYTYPNVRLDRNERYFSFNDFRDYVNTYDQPMFIFDCEGCMCPINEIFNNSIINPFKHPSQLQRFRDTYIVVRLIFDRNDIKLVTDPLLLLNNKSSR